MGVTDADWTALAYQGLIALDLDVALKSFIRVRDIRYVDLINRYVSMYVCMYVHMCVCVFV
jgi:intraflagellar transport protein 122